MPDRADIDAALHRFRERGLTPSISTNGNDPSADVEVTRGPRVQGQSSAPILAVAITALGQARLDRA